MKKRDGIIIAAVLLLAFGVWLLLWLTAPKAQGTVVIRVGGEVYGSYAIDDYRTVTVDQGDGRVNVVVIDKSGVHMESSTCKNQICVQTDTISPDTADSLVLEKWIVCLPNGVSVELTDAETEPLG